MNELGNRYALAALKDRRATLAGEIADLKKRLQVATTQLDHIDACLTIFEYQGDPAAIPAHRPRRRVKLFKQGELGRLILDALRRAGKPLGTHEITTALLEAGGYGESARPSLAPRVRGNLAYLESREAVTKAGSGKAVLWNILFDR
ncbi:MAG TPA: hypothetical protein VFS01_05170 [Rhizomicrobium sp.]|nr:hypothetical protein [Rhizomicrobium sp.]